MMTLDRILHWGIIECKSPHRSVPAYIRRSRVIRDSLLPKFAKSNDAVGGASNVLATRVIECQIPRVFFFRRLRVSRPNIHQYIHIYTYIVHIYIFVHRTRRRNAYIWHKCAYPKAVTLLLTDISLTSRRVVWSRSLACKRPSRLYFFFFFVISNTGSNCHTPSARARARDSSAHLQGCIET